MNRYTIYCTTEQTRKAIELGAPIDHNSSQFDSDCTDNIELLSNGLYAIIPTAEQMICWLEEQDIFINFAHTSLGYDSWIKRRSDNKLLSKSLGFVSSRKEATIAAIDAALKYLTILTNNKK